MILKCDEPMGCADQGLRVVRTNGQVGKLRRTVTADAVSCDRLDAEFQFLCKQGQTRAGAKATAGMGVIKRAESAWRGRAVHRAGHYRRLGRGRKIFRGRTNYAAGKDSVAEGADDSKEFVVAVSGVGSSLKDKVRCLVYGVTRRVKRVKQTTASSRSVDKEVLGSSYHAGG